MRKPLSELNLNDSMENMINQILSSAYDMNDLLDENQDELIKYAGMIIDICEKALDEKEYLK